MARIQITTLSANTMTLKLKAPAEALRTSGSRSLKMNQMISGAANPIQPAENRNSTGAAMWEISAQVRASEGLSGWPPCWKVACP